MSREHAKLPKFRFYKYTKTWGNYKIGNFLKESRIPGSNGAVAKKLTVKLWGKGVISKEDKYTRSEATQYFIRKKGQFIYGKLDFLNSAFGMIPEELDGYESTLDSPAFDISEELDSKFFLEYILRKDFYLYQGTIANGSRKAKRIHIDTFYDMPLILPKLDEQVKISSFFKQLDETIKLQQQYLEDYKQLKKTMLQKLFPKKNEKIPQIRFDKYASTWELRKFEDIFEFSISTNSLSRAQLNYDKGEIKSIHYGDILVNYDSIIEAEKDKIPYITEGRLEKYKSSFLENGDVIFADAAEDETVGKVVEINGINNEHIVAGLHTIVARSKEKMAEYFLGYYLNTDVYRRQLLRLIQGTKVSSISKKNLQKTMVVYPKNIEEQEKIGTFFKQLDNAIALHQRKLDSYEELKKAMLQRMFI